MATPTVKIKIEKTGEEITYQKKVSEHTFTVNGKRVRVFNWFTNDEENGDFESGTDIDEDDNMKLTDDEHEALSDELDTLVNELVGFKTEVNY